MSVLSRERGVVRHGHGPGRPEDTVVFGHDDARSNGGERLEDPIIVAIDIDRQESEVSRQPCYDLSSRSRASQMHGGHRCRSANRDPPAETAVEVGSASVDDKPSPSVMLSEKSRVRPHRSPQRRSQRIRVLGSEPLINHWIMPSSPNCEKARNSASSIVAAARAKRDSTDPRPAFATPRRSDGNGARAHSAFDGAGCPPLQGGGVRKGVANAIDDPAQHRTPLANRQQVADATPRPAASGPSRVDDR